MQTNQGLTLDRYLEKKSPLEPAQAARIAMQIAQQLGSAAGSLLIHPGRILVTKDGTVQLLPPPAEELSLPSVVEYPAYASPEEIRGAQPDMRSMLYSLGCTLHEVLTGAPPYPRNDPKQVLHAHLEAPIPDVREKSAGVPGGLAEVLKELLEKDPEMRIQTPEELIRRLKQSLGGGPSPRQAPRTAPRRDLPLPAPAPAKATADSLKTFEAPSAPRRAEPAVAAKYKSSATRAGTVSRAAGRRPLARHGRAEDEETIEIVPKQRTFIFALCGAVLGLILGLLAVHFTKEHNATIDANATVQIEQERKDTLAQRKKTDVDNDAGEREKSTQLLALAMKKSPEVRKDMLANNINALCGTPYSHVLAEELVKVWSAQPPASAAEVVAEDQSFQKLKAEAEKLYAEGKLGAAIEKMMEDNAQHQLRHGKEIDALIIDKYSRELTAKWEATKAESDKLGKDSEPDKAVEALQAAMEYGDEPIRREASRLIDGIRELATVQKDSANRPAAKSIEEEVEDKANGANGRNDEKKDAKPPAKAGPKAAGNKPDAGGSGAPGKSKK